MRNRWLVNLALLILVIALGTLMRRDLEAERRLVTLTELSPEAITEVAIERPGQPTIRLAQGADGWRMEAPYQVAADPGPITELEGIAATQVFRSLPAGTGTEQLGFNANSLQLTLNGLVLRFGDVDPVAGHRYVAIGEQVLLIGDGFYHHLTASAETYVSHKLMPIGFRPGTGTLDGKSLTSEQLAGLEGLAAEDVEPLGSELVGRLLSLTSEDGEQSVRFLVSPDGLTWSRLDLRLRYRLAKPPAWAVAATPAEPEAEGAKTSDLDR